MTATTETTAYHCVITLQWAKSDGALVANTCDGTTNLPAGSTRETAFRDIKEDAVRALRASGSSVHDGPYVILFFSMERNELT